MIPRWNPCAVGYPLYCAACDEDAEVPDAVFTAVTRPKWYAWEMHRDGCPDCKIRKETK